MSGYRPITDVWMLARPKLKPKADGSPNRYYGSYPAGFLERARALLGVHIDDPVLHVCAGMVRYYPYRRGVGPNDVTLDARLDTAPDYLADARDVYPKGFAAILADPPYTASDQEKYGLPVTELPTPREILRLALEALAPGRRVGILHYVAPRPPKDIPVVFVAKITVSLGYDNRDRVYSVYEKQ